MNVIVSRTSLKDNDKIMHLVVFQGEHKLSTSAFEEFKGFCGLLI